MPGVRGEKGNKGDIGDPGENVSKISMQYYQECSLILKGTVGSPGSTGFNGTKVSYNAEVLSDMTYIYFREIVVILAHVE